jgi:hypothetical protein
MEDYTIWKKKKYRCHVLTIHIFYLRCGKTARGKSVDECRRIYVSRQITIMNTAGTI